MRAAGNEKVFRCSSFSKMLPRCGRAAHICEANCICNKFFLLQLHFLKLANSQLDCFYETSYKFGQGNGAIAARWQAKAGVEPPFAGCGRPFSLKAVFHVKHGSWETTRIRFGKAGAHPQLAWESQLPLKPCLSLQPFNFKGNCDSSDSLLDFCFLSLCSFNLLRKCGLLAHTSPTFLKNCWIKKLFILPAARFFSHFASEKLFIPTQRFT